MYEHESNGSADTKSRSWDRTGIRYQTENKSENESVLNGSIKTWVAYNFDSENRDIQRYRGRYELEVNLSNIFRQKFDINLRVFSGGSSWLNPILGGQELTINRNDVKSIIVTKFIAQIYNGYSENMLDYNKKILIFRFGIGI